ncbi:putative alcohol O-acetyltransferase [Helianthus annuus]|nr:(Z)-3-hexen-1-ol acetyltransferase [Helianthus annuus]KAJ0538796.1 putative alcohol O-acetyltransferase [Helianthus annuus]KAJ0553419.1 putative alcohol O-acetyltransferase [Helianthus annuus]KAJ0719080.1 putative alcohol O-acetyltransferase [Helianthus annuus]KAJ0901503.1 putative alcohol O-acetyltransferase [Helianthus annuus]KAJ0954140.1 putative alcohol O-acetyltransferase [Helianthus annuus]
MGIKVKVIKTEVVAPRQPWSEHWLPLTNLDLVVPPIDMGCFFCYKKPHDQMDMVDALKTSLSHVLVFFYPIAGEIVPTATSELEIHCNYRGVDFTEAAADVELWELDFYNHDENIGVKLMPQEHHGVLAIQVTMLKCGGMVVACLFDHRVIDGYSMNMFTTSWANMTRSQPPSLIPYFDRSDLKPRHSKHYTPYVANMFFPLSKLPLPVSDSDNELDLNQHSRISRIYYIKGEQINGLRLLASENGIIRSKVESFASFLWKITGSFLEDSGHPGYMCNIAVPVDGRRWLSEGEGVEKENQMAARCGNVFSIPFRGIRAQDLVDMPLSSVASHVHELSESAATKEHFKQLIDWVEDQKPNTLISRPFVVKEKAFSIMMSSGLRFSLLGKMDFGWGKPVFTSCHVPTTRMDCHVMPLASPVNGDDWIVYMHLPKKQLDYMEARAGNVFKPLIAGYLQQALNPKISRI